MRTLVIDAYDSFVYTVAHYLAILGAEPQVVRNDKIHLDDIEKMRPDFILLGPGPGHPGDSGYIPIIQQFGGKIPIMGVCLGQQAIAMAFGGRVERAQHLMHGKISRVRHDQKGCFEGLPSPLSLTRYHSLLAAGDDLPAELEITATSEDDSYVMGLRHKSLAIEGVQFHPESITSEHGFDIFRNFMKCYVKAEARPLDIAVGA